MRASGTNASGSSVEPRKLSHFVKLTMFAFGMGVTLCASLRAQRSANDSGSPNMSGVTDVTPGWKYLLQNDDLVMVQYNSDSSGNVTTSIVSLNTANSQISGTSKSIAIGTSNPGLDGTHGVVASQASGRVFNTSTDSVGVLTAISGGWGFSLANSSGVQSSSRLNASFPPYGIVYTRVVMGDFNGDGLADPLVFYEDTAFNGNSPPEFE